ncbi:hypothetical protein B8V81_1250 [Paenibacillus pasadenensis]|uniref:Motility protein n=1 Tax=Paenibacillus pasadenensis TaxID=217090 RepID=A0A2N5N9J6_9BACL|nr:YjfB family protein [Paenibacillus pasadenensis]PLT47026.1 hypothetical protein B8V81_1250 [Paenibacillus pasadenensis]
MSSVSQGLAASAAMTQHALAIAVGTGVMNISKDMFEQQGQQLAEMIRQAPHPTLGGSLDIKV